MAFQPVPDVASIEIIYTQNGEPMQNSFYAHLAGGYIQVDLQLLATAIDVQVQGTWKTQQAADAVYVRTEVRGLAVINDRIATDNSNAGPGTHAGGSLPNNCTLVVKKSSGQTGRSARGRTYWIGCARTQLTLANDNVFEAVYVQDVVAAVDSIRAAIGGAGLWSPALVSRYTAGAQRPFGITFPWVSCSAVDNNVDTQRGRLP